jgi:hypothetical protein
LPTAREFDEWADHLRRNHPEMVRGATETPEESERIAARKRWHPLYLRVYGIRPWEMIDYRMGETMMLNEDLKEHGLGF